MAFPLSAYAQVGIGLAAVSGRTNEPDLRRPVGAGVSVAFFPESRFSVRGEVTVTRATRRLDGPLCVGLFIEPRECAPGDVEARSSLRTVALLGTLSVLRTERLRLQGGAGISMTSASGHLRSLGPVRARLDATGASGTAIPLFAALAAKPFAARSIWLNLEYRAYHGLEIAGCATDTYAPLCSIDRLREIRVGVSYETAPPGARR